MKKLIIPAAVILFSSCQVLDSDGFIWLAILFCLLLALFSFSVYLLIKRKHRVRLTLANFSADVKRLIDKYERPEDKIMVLEQLIERIEKDEKYKKTPDWKKSVLVKVYEHIAAINYRKGDESGVIGACSHIIELDPSQGMAYYNRGSVYNNRREYEKALNDFNDAVILLPDYSNLYNNRGLVYERLGRFDDALDDYNKALELEPSAIVYYNKANLFFENEKFDEAKENYICYLQNDPEDIHELKHYVEKAIEFINSKTM